MKFSLTLTFNPIDDQVALAKVADELDFHSINIGDGLFFYDETSVDYPYSDSGARYWSANTPFLDPFAAISAMGQVTKNVRFLRTFRPIILFPRLRFDDQMVQTENWCFIKNVMVPNNVSNQSTR